MIIVTYLEELAGVIITVVDADRAAINTDIEADAEISRHEWRHSVWLKNHVSFHESAHGHAGVGLFGFDNENALVLQEVVQNQVVDTMILNAIFNDGFLEVTVEAEHLNSTKSKSIKKLFAQF